VVQPLVAYVHRLVPQAEGGAQCAEAYAPFR
jgi:hypothetical protein